MLKGALGYIEARAMSGFSYENQSRYMHGSGWHANLDALLPPGTIRNSACEVLAVLAENGAFECERERESSETECARVVIAVYAAHLFKSIKLWEAS